MPMLHIGTSGWQYRDWRGRFYPARLAQREWLGHYAAAFATVEVNNTFYRLPERSTFTDWATTLPPGFVMAVKMSRYLTHVRRLADPAEPVTRFLDRAVGLGSHLGPVLLQLPPNLPARPDALAETLRQFAHRAQRADRPVPRVVVEPRHDSWWSEEIRAVLAEHGAALSWADRLGRPVTPLWRTAGFGYLRMHQGGGAGTSYGVRAIDAWLARIGETFAGDEDVYIYFNNDAGAAAVHNAQTMLRRCAPSAHASTPGSP